MRRHDHRYSASGRSGEPHRDGSLRTDFRLQSLSRGLTMADVREVETALGLAFDVLADGPHDGAPVLLLHGFAESFHTWDAQSAALARAGYRVIAPSQRGYSAGARPDPANTGNYVFDKLGDDPMQIASKLGLVRLHLVGHDWGGSIAWGIADKYPERLASLTIL